MIEGTLIRPDPSKMRIAISRGRAHLDGGRIERIETADGGGQPAVDESETLVFPGFTDAHLHLPQFDSIGADGLELLEWLQRVIYPAEARWADAGYARGMAGRVAQRLIAAGTTGIAAYATAHHAGAAAAIEVLAGRGLRGVVGQVLMDREAPPELLRPAEAALGEAASLEPAGRIEPAVTPRFAVSCSRELLEGAGELARRRGWAVQTHLAETRPECELVSRLHGKERYTSVYEEAGLLTSRTILGHGIWLDDGDRELLARRGCVVAHCPTANLFLQAGAMDLGAHRAAGVRVALGSDVAGGPDVSMVRVARAMIETAKRREQPLPTPEEAWWMITRGNGLAMGWADAGLLEADAAADLVVVQPDIPWRRAADPLGALLYAWDERWIRQVIVNGRVAYEGR